MDDNTLDALTALKWLIVILLGLFLAWAVFGSKSGIGGLFIYPPGPLGSGETYGDDIDNEITYNNNLNNLDRTVRDIQGISNSQYKGKVEISSYFGGSRSNVNEEQIELRVNNSLKEKINISNWRLESGVSGVSDKIGEGAYLPYSGQVNVETAIFVEAGDRIIINTGRSPIGSSFRINKCVGYFEQFQDFNPPLYKECPEPINDLPNVGVGNEAEACIDFVERLPRCELYLREVPTNIGGLCTNYVTTKINYNTCVDNHKNDSGFYAKEWRVYLGRNDELWKSKREIIKLLDQNGEVVDVVSY